MLIIETTPVTAFTKKATAEQLQFQYRQYLTTHNYLPFGTWLGEFLDGLFQK